MIYLLVHVAYFLVHVVDWFGHIGERVGAGHALKEGDEKADCVVEDRAEMRSQQMSFDYVRDTQHTVQ